MRHLPALALLLLTSCRGHGLAPDHFHVYLSEGDSDTSGHTGLRTTTSDSDVQSFTFGWSWDWNRPADEAHAAREEAYLARLLEQRAAPATQPEPEQVPGPRAAPEPAAEPAEEPPAEKILGAPPWVAKLTVACTVAGAVLSVLAKMGKLPWLRRKPEPEPEPEAEAEAYGSDEAE